MIIKTLKDIKKQLGFGDFRAFFVFFWANFSLLLCSKIVPLEKKMAFFVHVKF